MITENITQEIHHEWGNYTFRITSSCKIKAEVIWLTSAFILQILLQALWRSNLTEKSPRASAYDHIGQASQAFTNNCYDVPHVFSLLSFRYNQYGKTN